MSVFVIIDLLTIEKTTKVKTNGHRQLRFRSLQIYTVDVYAKAWGKIFLIMKALMM